MGAVRTILAWPGTVWLVRLGLVAPFAISAVSKLLDWPGAVAEAASLGFGELGFGAPAAVAAATVATQAAGSALVLTRRWCWLGAGILAVFTALATLIAHAFWQVDGPDRAHQMATFFEHVAIVAGFAAVAVLVNGRRP